MILPVFDRTEEDLNIFQSMISKDRSSLAPEEKDLWRKGFKACLNVSDINRIEGNSDALSKLMNKNLQTKSWVETDIISENEIRRILSNIESLRSSGAVKQDTPEVPRFPLNDYRKLNDAEKILFDLYDVFMAKASYFCGIEVYCGEDAGVV
jgi:hypothetical protein